MRALAPLWAALAAGGLVFAPARAESPEGVKGLSEETARSEPEQPLLAEPDDPLELVWSHRLNFAAGGAPLVTIRLVDGQDEIAFVAGEGAVLRPRGGEPVPIPAGTTLRALARDALPAALAYYPLLGDAAYPDRRRLSAARRLWEERGVEVRQRITGGIYGIAGRVVDNRRLVLVAGSDGSERAARDFAEASLARYGGRTGIYSEVVRRPSGAVEVLGADGPIARGDALVALEASGGFLLRSPGDAVAHRYRGRLYLTLDASGRLAAVLGIALEELLRGLVPSELPARSPAEALKAQAVTARSNVLAQIGTRHLTEPYVLCNEVHCQAYRGAEAETPATDAAVSATRGEALFGRRDRTLVDAVYSALCGGHGEDNDAVWPTQPNPSLRGESDLLPGAPGALAGGLEDEARLGAFLAAAPPSWCSLARGAPRGRYRWERRFTGEDLDAFASDLGVGHVRGLTVTARGVSGRARTLVVVGERGRGVVEGELRIRRFLGNLPSAMFVVKREGGAFVLHGGGWGHGVGMCQWGAVGRAQAGQDYRTILRAYYEGAEVARIY
ncbi:MAG TPA: SpoIID/LytB domain-containing protein [Anaeromyxobacteraceae bacterium]|nr:SpoIID/LytB domain-containing protein [Anaeromyxobacteraceae bacterium]